MTDRTAPRPTGLTLTDGGSWTGTEDSGRPVPPVVLDDGGPRRGPDGTAPDPRASAPDDRTPRWWVTSGWPVVSGGPTDPRSAHAVDVDAVIGAARRYADAAVLIEAQALVLARLEQDALAAVRVDAPLTTAGLGVAAAAVGRLAHLVGRNARDRETFAERARTAVLLYEEVDAAGADRFRRLLDPRQRLPEAEQSPLQLQQRGWCTTTAHAPEDRTGYAPLCPGASEQVRPPGGPYAEQHLELGESSTVSTTGAPGLAGLMQAVHDNYGARTPDGTAEDTIDVVTRIYRGEDGALHESYVVALAGTSRWDLPMAEPDPHRHRTMRPNLEGAAGAPSAEARLVPEALAAAGVPDGAEVLLAGHSQGGMTAMSAAALPAMRRYRVQVLTAGSPVSRGRNVPSVRYLHVQRRGDVVPHLDGADNRPMPNQVTVTLGVPFDPGTSHGVDAYSRDLQGLDARRATTGLPPGLEQSLVSLEEAGHLRHAGDDDAFVTTRFTVHRR